MAKLCTENYQYVCICTYNIGNLYIFLCITVDAIFRIPEISVHWKFNGIPCEFIDMPKELSSFLPKYSEK